MSNTQNTTMSTTTKDAITLREDMRYRAANAAYMDARQRFKTLRERYPDLPQEHVDAMREEVHRLWEYRADNSRGIWLPPTSPLSPLRNK